MKFVIFGCYNSNTFLVFSHSSLDILKISARFSRCLWRYCFAVFPSFYLNPKNKCLTFFGRKSATALNNFVFGSNSVKNRQWDKFVLAQHLKCTRKKRSSNKCFPPLGGVYVYWRLFTPTRTFYPSDKGFPPLPETVSKGISKFQIWSIIGDGQIFLGTFIFWVEVLVSKAG